MRVLILDNYDSFTYNLADYVAQFCPRVDVIRNDQLELSEVEFYSHIVLSPGPKLPKDAAGMMQLIEQYYKQKKILGVCLGMQAIAEFFGAKLYNLNQPKHGVAMSCQLSVESKLFRNISSPFEAGLYHSWAIHDVVAPLEITCTSQEGVIMGIQHQELPVFGLQFHPESILTPIGKSMIKNFLNV